MAPGGDNQIRCRHGAQTPAQIDFCFAAASGSGTGLNGHHATTLNGTIAEKTIKEALVLVADNFLHIVEFGRLQWPAGDIGQQLLFFNVAAIVIRQINFIFCHFNSKFN